MPGATIRALDGVSLCIDRGEYVAIMGPSGSGKSTLLNILGCLDLPTSGSYAIDGTDVASLSQGALAEVRGRRLGMVFQTFELLPRQTALRNVLLPLQYADGRPGESRHVRALAALARVGLSNRADHRPNQLSAGQRQRVAIARALVQRPDVLLADEPTGNLDRQSGTEILAIFAELVAEGQTIVMVTHDPFVASHCRRVVKIAAGRIAEDTRSPDAQVSVSASEPT